eukprot:COSAG04_NODE_411_length_14759_cov_28.639520_13_plen_229_part_00
MRGPRPLIPHPTVDMYPANHLGRRRTAPRGTRRRSRHSAPLRRRSYVAPQRPEACTRPAFRFFDPLISPACRGTWSGGVGRVGRRAASGRRAEGAAGVAIGLLGSSLAKRGLAVVRGGQPDQAGERLGPGRPAPVLHRPGGHGRPRRRPVVPGAVVAPGLYGPTANGEFLHNSELLFCPGPLQPAPFAPKPSRADTPRVSGGCGHGRVGRSPHDRRDAGGSNRPEHGG